MQTNFAVCRIGAYPETMARYASVGFAHNLGPLRRGRAFRATQILPVLLALHIVSADSFKVWTNLKISNPPSSRHGHTMEASGLEGFLYVFGGEGEELSEAGMGRGVVL
jgi:hypothetical protein